MDKAKLLQSVSAVTTAAATAAVGGAAFAQSGMPGIVKYTYSVQGGSLFAPAPSDPYITEAADKLASSGFPGVIVQKGFDPQVGINGAASLGVTFDNGWDARAGLTFLELPADTASLDAPFSFTGTGFSVSDDVVFKEVKTFGFETTDFEVGFTPTLAPNMGMRLFAGIRGLHFHSTDDGTRTENFTFSNSGFGSIGNTLMLNAYSTEFFGAGPRVGMSLEKRFDGSNFGVSGQVAGALIFGTQTDRSSSTFSSSSSYQSGNRVISSSSSSSTGPTTTKSYTKAVVDAEAQAGIDYYLNDATKLTFGYQVETLTNVGVGANSGQNQVAQGGFVKVTGSF